LGQFWAKRLHETICNRRGFRCTRRSSRTREGRGADHVEQARQGSPSPVD
jgi:hypothetical protein